jgi:hypothetical protein
MHGMYKYKNAKITPAKNGYIVCYDKYHVSKDDYEGMTFAGECKEIAKTGKEAIAILDRVVGSPFYSPATRTQSMRMGSMPKKQMDEDDD